MAKVNLFKIYQRLEIYEGNAESINEQAHAKGLLIPDNEIIIAEALYHWDTAEYSSSFEVLFDGTDPSDPEYINTLREYKQLKRFVEKYC